MVWGEGGEELEKIGEGDDDFRILLSVAEIGRAHV